MKWIQFYANSRLKLIIDDIKNIARKTWWIALLLILFDVAAAKFLLV